MGLTKQQLVTMTNYRIELQAFVDAAASFTEPALGHHKAWAEAVARARVALSAPESSTNSVCPITPPPELYGKWYDESPDDDELGLVKYVATQAAQWGADQELEACLDHVSFYSTRTIANTIRDARRPKPPSLKEQALSELNLTADNNGAELSRTQVELIRSALEQLND